MGGFNKIWIIRFFAVVNNMVRKFSFCSTFYADVIANIILLHIFYQFENSLYFMKHDPEVKSFIQIVTFIHVFHTKRLTSRVAVNFEDQTRYCTSINHLGTPLLRYNTRKYSVGESIFEHPSVFLFCLLAKTIDCTFLYISDKFQGVWMTKFFRGSVFYTTLKHKNYSLICSSCEELIENSIYSEIFNSEICDIKIYGFKKN